MLIKILNWKKNKKTNWISFPAGFFHGKFVLRHSKELSKGSELSGESGITRPGAHPGIKILGSDSSAWQSLDLFLME